MKMLSFLILSALLSVNAQAVTINFDTDPDGNTVATATNIDTLYTSLGVTFSRTGGLNCDGDSANAFANDDHNSDFGSLPNTISSCATSSSDISENLTGGLLRATFSTDVTSACIAVRPDSGSDFAVMRAYDISDTLVDTQTSTLGATEQLCVTGSALRRVDFSGSGNHYARFDDFVFTPVPLATPTKPTVKLIESTAKLTMQDYGVGATYQVTATHSHKPVKTRVKTFTKHTGKLKNLIGGKWKVRYTVELNSVTSDSSPSKSFIIE